MKLAIARLWFCSNSFVPRLTGLADFRAAEWSNAPQSLRHPLPGSEMDGLARFLAGHKHWRPTLLRAASAPAGGPLTAEVFGNWLAEVENHLRRERFDGVYLSLHGACQAEGDPIADLTIMRRVRAIVGHTPVVASFDMHANLSLETTLLLDGASTNRGWPHGGGDGAAIRALKMLEGIVAGRLRPVGALAPIAERQPQSDHGAAVGASDARILDASVMWGFPWGDSPYAGACAMVWTDRDAGLARDTAARLAQRMPIWRPNHAVETHDADAAIDLALAARGGRAMLLDLADDPLAGGLADTPELLRALLRSASGGAVLAALHDADLVAAAMRAGIGGRLSRRVAARTTGEFGPPIDLQAQVVRLAASGPAGGAMAVLRAGQTDIVVCAQRPAVVDAGLLARAGVDLDAARLLAVKGGEVARMALNDRFPTVIACDCPGPACGDLTRLPFKYSDLPHLPWSAGYLPVRSAARTSTPPRRAPHPGVHAARAIDAHGA